MNIYHLYMSYFTPLYYTDIGLIIKLKLGLLSVKFLSFPFLPRLYN